MCSYGHVVDEGVPLLPILDVEDGVVDGGRRCVDLGLGEDGESATIGDLYGGTWTGVGWVVEGFTLQYGGWSHLGMLSRVPGAMDDLFDAASRPVDSLSPLPSRSGKP